PGGNADLTVRDERTIRALTTLPRWPLATAARADEPGSERVSPARSRASADALCARTHKVAALAARFARRRGGDLFHCALILPVRMPLAHFSVSATISFPNSAGDPTSTMPPRSASRVFMAGSASAAMTSLLSLSTISSGVFLGAATPYKLLAS